MGRKRKTNINLPPYVYLRRGFFTYRANLGEGKYGPYIKLCPESAQISEIWRRYEEITAVGQPRKSVGWMIDQYLASEDFRQKSAHTQKKYQQNAAQIKNTVTKAGDLLGSIDADRITPGVIRKYMDTRPPVTANREKAFLSVCYQWCIERDYLSKNPCKEVKRNTETPDTRYITDAEYQAIYSIAPDYIRCAMELAYLCRMRLCEVLALRESDIQTEGLYITRRKGSRDNITQYNDRLNAAIALSKTLPHPTARAINPALIRGITGNKLTEEGFSSAWQRLMTKAESIGIARFKFHQLKAKGVSDTTGNKQDASGHKTAAMVTLYDRVIKRVLPAGEKG